jgi:hypothetical protein
MRHGADYGDRAVPGSSLQDRLGSATTYKYFLMDGVYRWDTVMKLGGEWDFKTQSVPLAIYAETGVVITRFTINGKADVGKKAEYESFSDAVYRPQDSFVFSIGFRLFR